MEEKREGPEEIRAEKREERQPPPPGGPDLGPTSTGIDPKLIAFLSYLLSIVVSFVAGLIFYLVETQNKFARFHAMQAVLFNVAVIVISIALSILTAILAFIPILGWLAAFVLWAAFGVIALVYWVVLMVKALQGEYYKLPYIGDWADRNA